MNTDQIVTAGSISSKIIAFFIFTAIEVICNSVVFFKNLNANNILQVGSLNTPNTGLDLYVAFAMLG